jgi:hypothetical protein
MATGVANGGNRNCTAAELGRTVGRIPPAVGMESDGFWYLSGSGRGDRPDHAGRQAGVGVPGVAAPPAPASIKAAPDVGRGAHAICPLLRVDTRGPRAAPGGWG